MKNHPSLILAVIMLTALSASVGSQELGIGIMEADADPLMVIPGTVAVRAFFVSNRNSTEMEFVSRLVLPEGWRPIGGSERLSLALKQGETLLAAFFVPVGAPQGVHRITLEILGVESGTVRGRYTSEVTIREVIGLDVEHADAPGYVLAGEIYRTAFFVTNTGNVRITAVLSIRSTEGFAYAADSSSIELPPGGTSRVVISVRTPEILDRTLRHYIRLTASGPAGTSATADSGVDVLPRISGYENPFRSIPSTAEIEYHFRHTVDDAGEDRYDNALLAQIRGQGHLDDAKYHHLSYLLRTPLFDNGEITTGDVEYRLAYETPRSAFLIGTDFFSLSDLTEPSRYGTGFSADLSLDPLAVGAFHLLTDPSPPYVSQTGAYVEYRLSENDMLRLNLLETVRKNLSMEDYLLGSMQGYFRIGDGTVLDAEYASGPNGAAAYAATITGTSPMISCRLKTLYSDPDFQGPLSDIRQFDGLVSIPLGGSNRLTAEAARRYGNLDGAVPSVQYAASAGITLRAERGARLSLTFGKIAEDGGDDRKENLSSRETGRLMVSMTRGPIKLGTSAEVSRTDDFAAGESLRGEKLAASLSYRDEGGGVLSADVSYDRESSAGSSVSAGFEVSYERVLTDSASLDVTYRSSDRVSSYYDGRDDLSVSIRRILSGDAVLTGRVSYSPDRAEPEKSGINVRLTLDTPYPLIIGRKELGRVAGTVTDRRTGRGIPDVILRIEDRVAVTDLYGNYLFHSVTPGDTYITVDPSRVPEEMICDGDAPVPVTVTANRETRRDIGLVRPASITGTVSIYELPETLRMQLDGGGTFVRTGARPEVILTLRRDGDIRRVITDRSGRYLLSGLRPGRWLLSVNAASIPATHRAEEPEIEVVLESGGTIVKDLRLLPVIRRIQIIDEGTVLEESE